MMTVPNQQLRSHLGWGVRHAIRLYWWKLRLGSCGSGVFFDDNVRILRYLKNVEIDNDVVLKEGCRICSCNDSAGIRIGKRTTIGYQTFIFASRQITIGSDCLIAPFVYIVDSDHGTDRSKKINEQPNISSPITIGDDVWIGTGARILRGVTIGNGAVIATGAIVNHNVEECQIVGGIPAKGLGYRS